MRAQIHPTAIVDDGAVIGAGTRVWHFVHVSAGAVIGEDCVLGQNVYVANGVRIGHRVRIQNNVSVFAGVEIADEVFLGPSCVFTNVVNPRAFVARKSEFRTTRVGLGASVGANATIVCGHDLGDYAFVAAGAVVTRDVPAYALVMGNPARQRGWACRCGERLVDAAKAAQATHECGACGSTYHVEGDVCRPVG